MIDVLGPEKRRRRTTQEKIAIVKQRFERKRQVTAACDSSPGIASLELRLI